jgi:hypothetical protein
MPEPIFKFPLRTLPLERFCEVTGNTPVAIRTKVCRSEWVEGEQYCKDPKGRLYVILDGYDLWVGSALSKAIVHRRSS